MIPDINQHKQVLRYYPLLAILLITVQLAASILGPRTIMFHGWLLPGGIWSFPITFVLWDIITEVYGFNRARQLIWYYVIGQLCFAGLVLFGLSMPAASYFPYDTAFKITLNRLGWLTLAMIVAITVGDYINCYVLDRIRIYTNGKHLWMRLIGATAIGELVTSIVWVVLFYFRTNLHINIVQLIICQFIFKIGFEIVAILPTYIVVWLLNKVECLEEKKRYLNFDPNTLELLY